MTTDVVGDLTVAAVCGGYWTAAWLLQKYRVMAPRDWLRQRVRDLRRRVEDTSDERATLDWLERSINAGWWRLPTSRVQEGWRGVHSIEDDILVNLSPEAVEERLKSLSARLDAIGTKDAKALKERIDAELKQARGASSRRALLQEASRFVHNVSDSNHENMAALLGKAVWLTGLALALVVALGAVFDRETYFMLGAAGALLSRLSRVLESEPKASDYGAAWSTLILSPAGGALAGWVAIFVVAALANDPFNALDDSFAGPWNDALSVLGLVVAFVSGFSERWFSRLLGTAEAQLSAKLPEEKKADK